MNKVFGSHFKPSQVFYELPVAVSYRELNWVWVWVLCYDRRSVGQSVLKKSTHLGAYDQIFITVWLLQICWWGTLSLTRGRICPLQLSLALASAVFLGSGSHGTRDHILLSQIRDFHFRRILRLARPRRRYSAPTPHCKRRELNSSQSQWYVTTDGQSASLSWYKAAMWGLKPDRYFCQTVAGLLTWGALSDDRRGLSFARVTVSSNKPFVVILVI
jgi:hypothetical protein